jgi:hypothetical protein
MQHLDACFGYGAKEFPVQFRPPGNDEIRHIFCLAFLGRKGLHELPEAKHRDKEKTAD